MNSLQAPNCFPLRHLLLLSAMSFNLPALAADAPPVAPVRPVTDTYFGTPVVDPYRYLENLKDPEVQSWMKAQAAYTRTVIDRIPGREALLGRIQALANVDTRRSGFVQRQQRYFYRVTEPGAEQPKIFYRDGLAGEEHLLLDPATLGQGTDTHYAVDYSAGWCSAAGELLTVREDVGRHNALDKLIGAMAIEKRTVPSGGTNDGHHGRGTIGGVPRLVTPHEHSSSDGDDDCNGGSGFFVVTSRASFEMVQKTISAGIGVLAAVSAPTALAVRTAERAGLTLAGFARGGSLSVYSHQERLAL